MDTSTIPIRLHGVVRKKDVQKEIEEGKDIKRKEINECIK
jgi:hypothetical protein